MPGSSLVVIVDPMPPAIASHNTGGNPMLNVCHVNLKSCSRFNCPHCQSRGNAAVIATWWFRTAGYIPDTGPNQSHRSRHSCCIAAAKAYSASEAAGWVRTSWARCSIAEHCIQQWCMADCTTASETEAESHSSPWQPTSKSVNLPTRLH